MIATAEALNEPTHTTEPCLNFLADHLLSDLHADNALCILKTRVGGPLKFPEMFSRTYQRPAFLLAADIQGLASRIKVRLALGQMKDQILALDKDHVIVIQHGGFGQGDAPTVALLDLSALQQERREFLTHGPAIDEPLILHTENPTTKEIKTDYYLADGLNSISELTGKDGTITGELVYNSFGRIVYSSGNALDQPYSYTGREFERETNIYYLRARYYDARTGRFLQSDIAAHETNLFIYAKNNPNTFFDPFGTTAWTLQQSKIIEQIIKFMDRKKLSRIPTNFCDVLNQLITSVNKTTMPNDGMLIALTFVKSTLCSGGGGGGGGGQQIPWEMVPVTGAGGALVLGIAAAVISAGAIALEVFSGVLAGPEVLTTGAIIALALSVDRQRKGGI